MAAARRVQLAADADLARALAEDETGKALDSGRRTMSGTDLTDKDDIVGEMQAEALFKPTGFVITNRDLY